MWENGGFRVVRWRDREVTWGRFCLSGMWSEEKVTEGVRGSWVVWIGERVSEEMIDSCFFRVWIGRCGVIDVDRMKTSNSCGLGES